MIAEGEEVVHFHTGNKVTICPRERKSTLHGSPPQAGPGKTTHLTLHVGLLTIQLKVTPEQDTLIRKEQ